VGDNDDDDEEEEEEDSEDELIGDLVARARKQMAAEAGTADTDPSLEAESELAAPEDGATALMTHRGIESH
jgi:hypothetical protein